jgi:quinol monooxygenase YgiN
VIGYNSKTEFKGSDAAMTKSVVRISKGTFATDQLDSVKKLVDESALTLVPAIQQLEGLLYYHVGVDRNSNTVVNMSIWKNLDSAKQMDTLQAMLNQRPILEAAGVVFDKIANYEADWAIGDL